jgi:hypothetical protein
LGYYGRESIGSLVFAHDKHQDMQVVVVVTNSQFLFTAIRCNMFDPITACFLERTAEF